MTDTKFTPAPWRWELNEKSKRIHLVGGKPEYDLTILEPIRWGMSSATFLIRDNEQDGCCMQKLHERRDWIKPFKGEEHHIDWFANINHPDMSLIASAPKMYAKLAQILADLEDKYEKISNEVEHYEIAGVQIGREVRNELKEHEQEINDISELLKKARGE